MNTLCIPLTIDYCRDRRHGRTLWTCTCHLIFFVWRPFVFLPRWRLAPMESPGLCECSIDAYDLFWNGPVAKLKILNPLTARLKIADTVSQLRQRGHLRAALRLLLTIRSMEVLYIHSVQGMSMQMQVPVHMLVEGVKMRSGRDRMIVCYPRFSFSARRWAGPRLRDHCCLQDIQWAAGEIVSYNPKLGLRYTLSPGAGKDSHTNRRRRQIRPVVYIQNVQG